MKPRKTRTVQPQTLRELIEKLLRASGCDAEGATVAAGIFLEADLRGIGLQGLDHLPTMIRALRSGKIDPAGKPRTMKEGDAFALVNGGHGPGQLAAVFAVGLAIAKARKAGVACIGVVDSADIFMIGYYAEQIARAGLVGLVFTDSPPLVHAHGGTERVLGTNPLAIGVPTSGADPIVVDLSTSAWSASRMRQAAYHEETVPAGLGVDAAGNPTCNPSEIRAGAISPLAGHKGFGLSLCVALLAGPLVGAQVGRALDGWMTADAGRAGIKGHLFLAIDPACFGDPAVFRESVSAYVAQIKGSRKAPGVTEIRIAGERAFAARARSLRDGVVVYEVVWQKVATLARELGVAMPG
jgi:L-2-hydroxycarboxylate dehydrogenase (NAD+)